MQNIKMNTVFGRITAKHWYQNKQYVLKTHVPFLLNSVIDDQVSIINTQAQSIILNVLLTVFSVVSILKS